MEYKHILPFAVLSAFISAASYADSEVSFGAGVGSLYSGLGINVALRGVSHIGYVAAGCVAIGHFSSSNTSEWLLPCGIGAGWIWTGLLTKANNRHGIGLYAGPVGDTDNGKVARYGLGVTYEYFLEGVNNNGWNFGITPTIGQKNGKTKGGFFLNTGYQF
jgi:hypothetical protein